MGCQMIRHINRDGERRPIVFREPVCRPRRVFLPLRSYPVNQSLPDIRVLRSRAAAQVELDVPAVNHADGLRVADFDNPANLNARLENLAANWHAITRHHFNSDY